ncbi:hypothetical protein [Salibacter halophilus]|uniref:Uncharacterized protein n=1 Tax=Salibacter halophilus TaxID=1803916 RepID=A0A6N6M5W9_9FLAO|nr:hypothetical protein [Salibacter halophilus]KAB1063223.1 hypothetical protein F3059_11310 [Salibacter halophilus]
MAKWLLAISLFVLFSCDREERTWRVQYEINLLENDQASVRAIYRNSDNADVSESPIDKNIWRSPVYDDFKEGDEAYIRVERLTGDADYEISILRDGAVHESDQLKAGQTEIEVRRGI